MLSILVAHSTAKGPAGTLLVTAVLEIFMSVLKTHADTTDKEWYLRLLPKISRPTMINTFFQVRALSHSLCPCAALALSFILLFPFPLSCTASPDVSSLECDVNADSAHNVISCALRNASR